MIKSWRFKKDKHQQKNLDRASMHLPLAKYPPKAVWADEDHQATDALDWDQPLFHHLQESPFVVVPQAVVQRLEHVVTYLPIN